MGDGLTRQAGAGEHLRQVEGWMRSGKELSVVRARWG